MILETKPGNKLIWHKDCVGNREKHPINFIWPHNSIEKSGNGLIVTGKH